MTQIFFFEEQIICLMHVVSNLLTGYNNQDRKIHIYNLGMKLKSWNLESTFLPKLFDKSTTIIQWGRVAFLPMPLRCGAVYMPKEEAVLQSQAMKPLEDSKCGSLWLWVSWWWLSSGSRSMNDKGKNRQSRCRCVENFPTSKDTIKIVKVQPPGKQREIAVCHTSEISFSGGSCMPGRNGIWLVIPGALLCAVMRNVSKGRE